MDGWFSSKPEFTAEELAQIQQTRKTIEDGLQNTQVTITAEYTNKKLSSETANQIYKLIKDEQDWLKKNPNATALELTTHYTAFQNEVKRYRETDPWKRTFTAWVLSVPIIGKDFVLKKYIDAQQQTQLEQVSQTMDTWFQKNKQTATVIEFQQEFESTKVEIRKILKYNEQYYNELVKRAQGYEKEDPDALRTLVSKEEATIQKAKDQEISKERGIELVKSSAGKTISTLLTVVLCIIGGSFAANLAIGRKVPYRILYFAYGALPWSAFLVVIYTIFLRITQGPVHFYALLPLFTQPAESTLGKIFKFPFLYVPDEYSQAAKDAFEASLRV